MKFICVVLFIRRKRYYIQPVSDNDLRILKNVSNWQFACHGNIFLRSISTGKVYLEKDLTFPNTIRPNCEN